MRYGTVSTCVERAATPLTHSPGQRRGRFVQRFLDWYEPTRSPSTSWERRFGSKGEVAALICDVGSSPNTRHCLGAERPFSCLSARALSPLARAARSDSPDAIFELAVGAHWKACSYHIDPAGRDILAVLIWPIGDHLANAELVG